MRVLVLGGYGFIGQEVCRRLLAHGYEVIALGRSLEHGRKALPQAQWRSADIATLTTPELWSPLLAGAEVLWQTGPQDVSRFGVEGRASVPHAELAAAIAEADVVVSHAGVGAALTAIEAGRCPVLVPRLARFDEHIDDHQVQIAQELARRGLAIAAAPEQLDEALLLRAASSSTRTVGQAAPFALDESASASAA